MVIHFIGTINSSYRRGKDKQKRKERNFWKSPASYIIPAIGGGVASLGGKTVKGKLVRGAIGAGLTGATLLTAKKLDDANESGKLRDWGSKSGLNKYKKK